MPLEARPRTRQLRQGRRGAGRLRAPPRTAGALLVVPTARRRRALLARAGRRGGGARIGAHVRRAGARDRPPGRLRRAAAVGAAARAGAAPGRARRRSARRSPAPRRPPGSSTRGRRPDRRAPALADHAAAVRRGDAQLGRADDRRRGPTRDDVAAIYLAYARELERLGRVDAELYAWRALDALRAGPGRWGDDPVFFYGFDDLHPLERDAVETLARVVGRAGDRVADLRGRPRARSAPGREVVEELRPLADRVLELPALDEHYDDGARAPRCTTSSATCSSPSPQRVDPGDAVRLLEAGGERAEAELVAAEVLELLRAGVAGDEIAVVYRSPGGARRPRSSACSSSTGSRSRSSAGCRSATPRSAAGCWRWRAARCSADRARAEDLLDYLRSPGLLERPELADRLEAEAAPRRACAPPPQAREQLRLDARRGRRASPAREPTRRPSWRARPAGCSPRPHRRPRAGGRAAEELDARALATMLRALAELDELGGALCRRTELIELLEGLTRGPTGAPGAPRRGAGLRAAGDPGAPVSGGVRLRAAGGRVPAGEPRPSRSCRTTARRELAACSGLRLRPRDDALARERYLFYACISRADRAVVLSYRSSDEEGNLALPSPFIADVAELLDPRVARPPAPAAAGRRRVAARARRRPRASWPAPRRPLARGRPVSSPSPLRLAVATRAAPRPPQRDPVRRRAGGLRRLPGASGWSSASSSPSELEPEPDPMVRGSYMHEVLEQVIERLGRRGDAASRCPTRSRSSTRCWRESSPPIARRPGRGRPRGGAARDRGRPAALPRARGARRARVGAPGARAAVRVRGRGGARCPRSSWPAAGDRAAAGRDRPRRRRPRRSAGGRPRLQERRSRARTTRARAGSAERRLQVALYMLAVRDLLGLEPVAGLYQPLTGPTCGPAACSWRTPRPAAGWSTTDARDEEQLARCSRTPRARAIALAARLRAGELTPCPTTCSRDGCRYPGICRSQ